MCAEAQIGLGEAERERDGRMCAPLRLQIRSAPHLLQHLHPRPPSLFFCFIAVFYEVRVVPQSIFVFFLSPLPRPPSLALSLGQEVEGVREVDGGGVQS